MISSDAPRKQLNQRSAEKLIAGIRYIYSASRHLPDEEIKQKFKQLLADFNEHAPSHLDTSAVLQELKNYFSLQTPAQIHTDSAALLPAITSSAVTSEKTSSHAIKTPSATEPGVITESRQQTVTQEPEIVAAPSARQGSLVQGLGYDARLASLLLKKEELSLNPALQRKQMLIRVLHAKKIAEQHGLSMVDLLENLDLILKTKNESFFQAVNQSFYTIIHHLNPIRAKKLRLPLASDIGRPRWLDLKRVKRLIEYIQCGRMAKDTAADYQRRIQLIIKQRQRK